MWKGANQRQRIEEVQGTKHCSRAKWQEIFSVSQGSEIRNFVLRQEQEVKKVTIPKQWPRIEGRSDGVCGLDVPHAGLNGSDDCGVHIGITKSVI